MSTVQEILNRLKDNGKEREKLLERLSYWDRVSELLESLGVERVEGEPIRLTPVGRGDAIVAVKYEGVEYRLPTPVACDEWREKYGDLR